MNAKQKFIILGTTLLLSGCGIYTKYEPQDTVPDNLYGEEAASLSALRTSLISCSGAAAPMASLALSLT